MAGELINKENYLKLWPASGDWQKHTLVHDNGSMCCYVNAVSFYIYEKVNCWSGSSSGSAIVKLWYYDEVAKKWVLFDDRTCSTSAWAWWDDKWSTASLSHNYNPAWKTNLSNNHRWFINARGIHNSSGTGHCDVLVELYLGTARCTQVNYKNGECDFLFERGKPIYGLQPSIITTSDTEPKGGGLDFHSMRGNPINSGTGKYMFAF